MTKRTKTWLDILTARFSDGISVLFQSFSNPANLNENKDVELSIWHNPKAPNPNEKDFAEFCALKHEVCFIGSDKIDANTASIHFLVFDGHQSSKNQNIFFMIYHRDDMFKTLAQSEFLEDRLKHVMNKDWTNVARALHQMASMETVRHKNLKEYIKAIESAKTRIPNNQKQYSSEKKL